MKKILSVFYILVVFLYSCSTDFDVVAPYKEIMVVDGLINAIDPVQNIKITKAFLGEGNAYAMATHSDSIYYADVLDVKMQRIFNNQVVETFDLIRTENNNKDSGTFAYPYQVVYTTNHPILQDDSEYKINVTNRETGLTVSSQTKIVKDLVFTFPIRDSIDLTGNGPAVVRFNPGANSRIFDMIIRFRYREIDPQGNSTEHYIDWNLTDKNYTQPPQEISYKFSKNDLFYIIGLNIPDKPIEYIRRTDSLSNNERPYEFMLVQGSEDLQTYYQLQQPTTGIVQEVPTFTTVKNGLGLFTSRIVHSLHYFPNTKTEEAFDTSAYTRTKNFKFN